MHAASAEYGFDRFVTDPGHLSDVVRFDRPLLGDVTGLTGIHLQCHIGTDTLSLARLGARMTGLDLSPVSLAQARRLATDAGADVEYVEADTYSAPAALDGRTFDLVYTGVGALCWLPDIDRWAGVVDDLLEPGGRLFVREGHPMMWAVDETRTDGLTLGYAYFETPEPFDLEEDGHLRRERPRVRQHPPAVLEPRDRRDPDRPAVPRVRGHRVRRAPQRALGGPARPDGARRRPRRVAAGRRGGAAAAVVHAAGPQALVR